jgi:segregation and condensation protein B
MDETIGSESHTAAATDATDATPNATLDATIVETKPRASAALMPTPESLAPSIEALILSVDRPLPAARIAEALGLIPDPESPTTAPAAAAIQVEDPAAAEGEQPKPSKRKSRKDRPPTPTEIVGAGVDLLNKHYEETGRAFRIQAIAGGYRLMTLPKFAPVLEAYHGKRERHGVSRAALETLAIIAYRQPVTRAGLEAIRGVACGEVLRSLIERRLITIVGRAEELGRPMLYGTTKAFLETFGLASVKDLPTAADLRLGGEPDEATLEE